VIRFGNSLAAPDCNPNDCPLNGNGRPAVRDASIHNGRHVADHRHRAYDRSIRHVLRRTALIQEFHHIHFRASSFDEVRAFYCGVLEAEDLGLVTLAGAEHLRLKLAGQILNFAPDAPGRVSPAVPATERLGIYHIAFTVDNLEKSCADYESRGARFASDVLRPTDDLKVRFIQAPDGMHVELMELLT